MTEGIMEKPAKHPESDSLESKRLLAPSEGAQRKFNLVRALEKGR